MKQRIITGAIGIVFYIVILFFCNTIMFNITIGLLSVIALWEILVTTKYVRDKTLLAISVVFTSMVPFFTTPLFVSYIEPICFVFIIVLLLVMIFKREKITLEQISLVFMMSLILPLAFSSLIYLRDIGVYSDAAAFTQTDGTFLIILATLGAWMSDAGGYFVGSFFGKHPLAPKISPKKTVEGAIGSVLFNILSFIAAGAIYQYFWDAKVSYPVLVILSVVCAVFAMLGDLSASVIKRFCHIKDFGNIIPGHGGILDRFDSLLLVSPLIFMVARFVPIIIR